MDDPLGLVSDWTDYMLHWHVLIPILMDDPLG